MEKSGSPGRDQQDQLTSRSLGKWHGNSKKLSTLPTPWKRAEQFPWVPWPHHTCALQRVPIEESSRIQKGASTWGVVYSLLVCPLKHPIKHIPHTKLRISTSVPLKFSWRTGEIRERRRGKRNCECVEQYLKEEAFQLNRQIFFSFQVQTTKNPEKKPSLDCQGKSQRASTAASVLRTAVPSAKATETQVAKATVTILSLSMPWDRGNEPRWASNQTRSINSVFISTFKLLKKTPRQTKRQM